MLSLRIMYDCIVCCIHKLLSGYVNGLIHIQFNWSLGQLSKLLLCLNNNQCIIIMYNNNNVYCIYLYMLMVFCFVVVD